MTLSQRDLPLGVSQSTLDHFAVIPWTQSTLNDPAFRIVSHSRTVTHGGIGHTLTGKTWNTDGTIKELLSFWRPSPSPHVQTESGRAELRRFYTFGGDLNAHPGLLHGGVIGCILDSSMGGCVGMVLHDPHETFALFTAQLNIAYKKPVKTPGTVVVRSWATKIEDGGRKVWVHGVVEGEGGVVHATAEGLWVRPGVTKAKI
ncbi:major facilitator superfamily transporter [Paraphaeosphaeria sporulosa]